jgi:ABC-type microcin C transport system permease subunit YejE
VSANIPPQLSKAASTLRSLLRLAQQRDAGYGDLSEIIAARDDVIALWWSKI